LYPYIGDHDFQANLAERKEFAEIPFETELYNVEEHAKNSCESKYDILPHQQFVRYFLSQQTPYNSLLLYHGLGTGKTCSAIGIAEEMRYYIKQLNLRKKIMIVAFPNVQDNFRRQLFDDTILEFNSQTKTWNIQSCVGKELLKEIDPYSTESPEVISQKMKHLIHRYYDFRGYLELANLIAELLKEPEIGDKKRTIENRIHHEFDNRLVIIDEVHNIRTINENNNSGKIINLLTYVVQVATNMRLILLSATPVYNSPREIISLANLLLTNDRRTNITQGQVFDSKTGDINKQVLIDNLTGYISFVRGENPYYFPFRVYPRQIPNQSSFSILNMTYPTKQIHGEPHNQKNKNTKILHTDVRTSVLSNFQHRAYDDYLQSMLETESLPKHDNDEEPTEISIEGEKKWGYKNLQQLSQAMDIVFPGETVNLGEEGLKQIVNISENKDKQLQFEYKKNVPHIFKPEQIGEYSTKMNTILNIVDKSSGVILIFAEYIWGGIVPLALALEERGFQRFKRPNLWSSKKKRPGMSYTMITGVSSLSPNNAEDVKLLSRTENKNGDNVKVILISTAGSEGLDFKFIRQIHILNPWYTMNRLEQIIGRGVRNGSHCSLPFAQRNVEIYMHAAVYPAHHASRETADLYLYRYAEKKAIQIGKVNRILKEISVDCRLNTIQHDMSRENMNQNVQLLLSNEQQTITYAIGDQPYSGMCDYMERCDYQCISNRPLEPHAETYNSSYLKFNAAKWMERLRNLFRSQDIVVYTVSQIIQRFGAPREEIEYALQTLADDTVEYLYDVYGRQGRLLIRQESPTDKKYIVFQPLELPNERATLYERQFPRGFTRDEVFLYKSPRSSRMSQATLPNIIDELQTLLTEASEDDETKSVEQPKDKEWISYLREACHLARTFLQVPEKQIQKALIHHYLDESSIAVKKEIARDHHHLEWSKDIEQYIQQNTINNKWLVLYDKDQREFHFLVKNKKNEWLESTKQSFLQDSDMTKRQSAWLPSTVETHPVGYIGHAQNRNDMVFKVIATKNIKAKGVYLFNDYSQSAILEMFDSYLFHVYNVKPANPLAETKVLVVLMELLMRVNGHCDSPEKKMLISSLE